MDQSWSGRAMVPGGMYHGIHEHGYSEQQYEQNFNDAGVWNENPYPPFDTPDDFGGFQDQEHPQDVGQYDGQYEGQYDDRYVNQEAGQDVDQDDAQEVPEEDDQDEDQPNQAELHKAEVDRMIDEGVYQCLIPTEAHYFAQSRIHLELKELKKSGVQGAALDDVSKQYWVGRLFLAFKNVEGIKDKPCKNGKPAQSAQRLSGNYYPGKAVEMACWKIVSDCCKAASGVQLVDPHHNTKVEEYDTFEERMETIINICKYSKATCKQLLDPPYHLRLIDAPENESSVKENNRRLNSRRDVQNAVGRAQLQSKGIKIEDIAKQNIKLEDLVDHDSDLDEGLGSVSEDADDYYTTPKRTPAGKPRSGSARTPSKKGVFSTPQEATPLSLKRKRRTVSAKNYREGNTPSSEDSDVSEYDDDVARGKNSSKRPATGSPRDRAESPTPSRPRTWPGKSLSKRLSDSAAVSKESQDDFHSESYDQHRGDASSLGFYGHPRRASRSGFDDSLQVDSGFDVFDGLQSASESAFIDRLRGAAGVDSFDGLQGPSDSGSNDQVQVISTSGSNDQFPGTSDSGSYDQVQGASDSSSNGRLRGASGSGYYDRVQHLPASQLPYPIPGLAADNLDDGKLAYKHILCDLLQVPKILANSFTLEEFRIYGRAYNNEFASDLWQITAHDGKQFTCKTFRLHDYNKNKVVAHFCFYKFHMAYLAVARGDLHTNATLNRESPHIGGFWTYGDVEKDMALGVIDNPFGLHPQKIPGLENHMF